MLRQAALAALQESSLAAKLAATAALNLSAPIDTSAVLTPTAPLPGREARPVLVPPAQLRKRAMSSREGQAAMLHAIAHIELNAVDLGLDIVWRFAGLPEAFYRDWLKVAQEEVYHFTLVREHLQRLGYDYGDFPAHNGLWEMAEKTADDLLGRLAIVPRTMEARGLDVNLSIQARFRQIGDQTAVDILEIILRDEIGHVAAGNRWYHYLCAQRGLDPVSAYPALLDRYRAPRSPGPHNLPARRAAGFAEAELAALQTESSV